MSSPILILGSGAMACLFAARFAAAGSPVTILSNWEAGVRALKINGVQLQVPGQPDTVFPIQATTDPEECRGAAVAFVMVKSWQTREAAAQLAHILSPFGVAITLQNGLGNYEILSQALHTDRVAAGVTTLGATLIQPGIVLAQPEGEIVAANHPRIDLIADPLTQAGFSFRQTDGIKGLLWGKLVVNAAINPLTALLDVPNGRLLEKPIPSGFVTQLVHETVRVADRMEIHLPYDNPLQYVQDVIRKTAANSSSMRQDRRRGAPTEVDAINGAVVYWGRRCDIFTPYNYIMWRLVRATLAKDAAVRSIQQMLLRKGHPS
jgi:2-dehydropantoate 2-reductase